MKTLASAFSDCFGRYAERTAVTDPTMALTYRDLADRSGTAAAALRRGMRAHRPADADDRVRVGFQAANSADYVVCYVAALQAGYVPFLIDAALGPAEVARIVEDCSLDLLIHGHSDPAAAVGQGPLATVESLQVTVLRQADGTDGDRAWTLHPDTEVCRFTSGSTGKANCIEFSGHAVARAAANWSAGTGMQTDDRIACFAALSNGLAFNTSLLSAFLMGASLHLARGLPTGGHLARMLARTEATWLVGFPALYESVVRRQLPRETFGRLRVAVSSAAPLREATRMAFTELTGVPIANYYGVAETGPLTFAARTQADAGQGVPLPGVRLLAGRTRAEPAEIRAVSESRGTRYLNAPGLLESRLDADGYYRTGDEGYLTERGLFLTGRSGRMINVAGRKVDPQEVASVLQGAAGVREVAVFEVTDAHGETMVAAAVTADADVGVAPLTEYSLTEYCLTELAAYKVPRIMRIVAEIPRSSTGKPSLELLRQLFQPEHQKLSIGTRHPSAQQKER